MAHGPQIQITRDNDKIVTRLLILESPYTAPSSPKSAYVIPLRETGGVWYTRPNNQPSETVPGAPQYLSGPGVAYGSDQVDGGLRDFAADANFVLNLVDGLKWWNGSAFVDPGAEQVQAFRGPAGSPSFTATTNDGGLPSSLPFGLISATYDSDAHGSASYRLLGDGTTPESAGDNGVYLLSLQLSSTEAGLAPSEPYYFVLHKNASASELEAAVENLRIDPSLVQHLPEPTSWILLATGAACLAAGVRRRVRACRQSMA
jgi:hypothetical protein